MGAVVGIPIPGSAGRRVVVVVVEGTRPQRCGGLLERLEEGVQLLVGKVRESDSDGVAALDYELHPSRGCAAQWAHLQHR